MIRIGCCGWSYKDWIGPFYPEELRTFRGRWLEYYAQYFPTVEIDSTYYRVPPSKIIQIWIEKGRRIEDFDFSLKMHKDVTHTKILEDGKEAASSAKSFEKAAVDPLGDSGLLGSVLIQLSPRFKRTKDGKDSGAFEKLKEVLDVLRVDDYDYAVEFRHKSWLDSSGFKYPPEVEEALSERNVAICSVDSPYFPPIKAVTANHSYLRFHGRNYDIWWKNEKDVEDHRINRYDYLYSEEELDKWIPRIKEFDSGSEKTRIYFNNHGKAKAARNGLYLMRKFGVLRKEKDIRIKEQFKLESFR